MKNKIRKPPSPLRILRLRTGLTLRQAGDLVGKTGQTILNWETGEYAATDADLKKLRGALRRILKQGA